MKLPSDKEALILSLLAKGDPLYGLQLVELSEGLLKRGTIYVTLGRLQDKGLVRASTDGDPSGHPGMPRPRYRITAHGSRALQAREAVAALLRPRRGRA
jgi:PadR family transcriptional regulator, regulatory protein PadR